MRETGITDCEGRMIHEGDMVVCCDPIFVKPKKFIVKWDSITGTHNVPTSSLRNYCRIVEQYNENELQEGIHESNT